MLSPLFIKSSMSVPTNNSIYYLLPMPVSFVFKPVMFLLCFLGSSEYVMESIRFLQVVAGAFNRELGASPSSEILKNRDLLEMKTDDINLSSVCCHFYRYVE